MRTMLLLILIAVAVTGCRKDLTNKEHYTVKVGESFEIFTESNGSIRLNEFIDESREYKHIRLKNEEVAQEAPADCDGCSTIYSYTFEGTSPGTDTVKMYSRIFDPDTIQVRAVFIVTVSE